MIGRFQEIDDLVRRDHYYLSADDKCFFIGEYTARKGYAFSETNRMILNLKKKMDRKGRPEWKYKGAAIQSYSSLLHKLLTPEFLAGTVLVPMPPSKAPDDPLYDDRLVQILQGIPGADARTLLIAKQSTVAAHETEDRLKPDQLDENFRVDETQVNPYPLFIAVVDDVLTTGAHFVAAKRRLLKTFSASLVIGIFLARSIRDSLIDDFTDLDALLS